MKTNRASLQSRLQKREGQLSTSLSRVLLLLQLPGGACLARFFRDHIDKTLRKCADAVFQLILQFAFVHMSTGAQSVKGARIYVERRALQAHFTRRAAIGGIARRKFKRAFTQKNFIPRIQALLDLLAAKEKLVARLARRLSKGLTRRGFAYTRAPLAVALGLETDACDIACAALALTPCAAALPDTS